MTKLLPLVWKNLGRNPLRSFLTGGAIALAIALVCLLRTMPGGFDTMLRSLAGNSRISIHNVAGIVYPMPYSYLNKVRAVPGVVDAVSWTWFGGAVDVDRGVQFPNFAVDAESIGRVFEDRGLTPEVVAEFQRNRDGALVGRQTMQKMGWKDGDLVTLQSLPWGITLQFRIVAGFGREMEPVFWFHRTYLEEALRARGTPLDQIGMIWARVEDPEQVTRVMAQVDEMFRNSEAETESETEQSFFQNFFGSLKGFIGVIQVVALLVTLCIVFIAANTASMAVRERLRELAVLKAIGFRWRLLFWTLVAEAALLSTMAGLVGTLGSLGLTALVRSLVSVAPQMGPLASFVVTNAILVQSLFLGLFIGILAGVVPSWGAARRSVALTLREVF